MEIDIYTGTLGSPLVPAPAGDGNAFKTTTTSFYSTNGKSNEQGEPHESPDQVPQDGMEIEVYREEQGQKEDTEEPKSASKSRATPATPQSTVCKTTSTSHHNLDQQGESQEMEELGKVDTVQATISRISDQTKKEHIAEKGSRKRPAEEASEPARKAKKKCRSNKARAEKKMGPKGGSEGMKRCEARPAR